MAILSASGNTSSILDTCDTSFGPAVSGCRSDFDFSLLFEQSILSIGPSAIFVVLVPFRAFYLSKQTCKVRRNPLCDLKLVANITYGALQLALLVLWAQLSVAKTRVSVAAAGLDVLVAIALCLLSYSEHLNSVRPSTLISAYLFFTAFFDAVQCRTLWLAQQTSVLAGVFTASLFVKILMLFLESKGKRKILHTAWQQLSLESTSGIMSRAVFWWLRNLLLQGFKTMLSIDSMYATDQELGSEHLLLRLQKMWDKRKDDGHHALFFALIRSLKIPFLLGIFPRICLSGFRFAQPFLIHRVIDFVSSSDKPENKNIGYGLIGATGIIYLGISLSTAFYQHMIYRAITMIRGSLTSLIYSRIFELHATISTEQGSATLTLTSTDVDRICSSFEDVHELWANPIEVAIAIWLLERQLGVACIAPALVVIICTGAAVRLSKYMGPARKLWNASVQHRVSVTSTIVGSMKEVKLLGCASSWLEEIQSLRVNELNQSKKFRKLIIYSNMIGNSPSMLAPMLTFGVFVLVARFQSHETLSIATVFTSLSIMSLLMGPLAHLLSAIPNFASSMGCFERIQTFLLSESHNDCRQSELNSDGSSNDTSGIRNSSFGMTRLSKSPLSVSVSHETNTIALLDDCSFSLKNGEPSVLKNINLKISRSTLTIVTGKVGSGKSMLLKGLLGELCRSSGSAYVRGEEGVAYCNQQSWLLNSTIKENIIGQTNLDELWYRKVVNACALDVDLLRLPGGDGALIGSKGQSLSDGQKQRVCLARAIYSRKHFLIVDNVLSGLDWKTKNIVWTRVFGPRGLLRIHNRTVILATHSLSYMRDADNIIVLEEGRILEQGAFNKLRSINNYAESQPLVNFIRDSSDEFPLQVETVQSNHNIQQQDTELVPQSKNNHNFSRRSGETALYQYYLNSIGWTYGALGLFLGALSTFFIYFPQVWLMYWSQADTSHPGSQTGMYYGIYAMFCLVGLLCIGLNIWFMFVIVIPKSAQNLHLILLRTVMRHFDPSHRLQKFANKYRAPLSYFVSTDSGVIINRFSQDMSLIDMQLPSALFTTLSGAFSCLASAIIILIGAKYLATVLPIALIALYFLQLFYLRTSRQIRYLDLEAKSPLYSHILETVSGLVTVRAFGWQTQFRERNLKLLDISQRPFYLMYCIQRWLNLVLDLFIAALAVLLVTLAVEMKNETSAGAIGLAMTNVLGFNESLSEFILSWTSLETSLGAIARLRNFEIETPAEPLSPRLQDVEEDWPSHGAIRFTDISASYSTGTQIALAGLSLDIITGEKVAICGRTGSGKSSLLLTLFRLLELDHGKILIDGVDISNIPQDLLRERLIVVPQEPLLFPGTLRSNLLPPKLCQSHQPSDDTIIAILEQVDLWTLVQSSGGLDASISSIPFSQGQKQLFCLARAVFQKRKGKILVLDEAMSSVDNHTESLMSRVVREEFKEHTVLAVAHRLRSIADFSKIVVLEDGMLVEAGNHDELLGREDGKYRELWDMGL